MSAQEKPLDIDDGCEVCKYPEDDGNGEKKLLVRAALPSDGEFYAPTFHYDNVPNQIRAVTGRVIGKVVKPSHQGIARLTNTCDEWGKSLYKVVQAPLDEMPNLYSGAKRARYLRALDRFNMVGLSTRDAYCNAFVKAERFDGNEKSDPDPRMIQFRGAKYCVELASYLRPGEHQLYKTTWACLGVPPSRNIAKGLNQKDRAMLLLQKMSYFDSPVVVSLDASRFDKHVSKQLLRVEHRLYSWFNNSPRFKWLLSLQLVNKVFTKLGMKYIAEGRRMSGDMNTALGNCVLMLMMVVTYCSWLQLARYDMLDDGDDVVVIIESNDLEKFRGSVIEHFLDYGMEMKVECVASTLPLVTFCRSNPVNTHDESWKFVRHYRDVVSKALTGIRHWQDPNYRAKAIKAIGMCELSLNLGVPVLQAFAVALLRNSEGVEFDVKYLSDGLRVRWNREFHPAGPVVIEDCARVSFESAFGVSWARQVELEEAFSQWTFSNPASLTYWGQEWNPDWIHMPSNVERHRLA